jgi:hypothetical protein
MAPIPEASMISCLKWAHFRLVIYCNSSILQHIIYISYISSTKKALHIIQSTSIHYFQSSSTIPWYPSYKMLGLKDPAFENRPSRPHSVCSRLSQWAVMAGRRLARCQATEKRHTASWGKAGRGETYGAGPRTNGISRKIWDGFTGWCPPVISWFINPINYSYICHKP